MRRRLVLLGILVLMLSSARAQECNCEKEFLHVKHYMELNHPGLNTGIIFNTNLWALHQR
jgi:hypothetical protein